jgi:hypothetical protein
MVTFGACVTGYLLLIALIVAVFCSISKKKAMVRINGHPMDRSDY